MEEKLSGYRKLVKWLKTEDGFKKVSTETSAESVIMDDNGTTLKEEMASLKKSVSDGKTEVAAAITAKKVPTAADATFDEMATNIGKIVLGSGNATEEDVLLGKTFTNDSGVELTGKCTLESMLNKNFSYDFLPSLKSNGTASSTNQGFTANSDSTNKAKIVGTGNGTGYLNVYSYCQSAINFTNYKRLRIVVETHIPAGEAFTIWHSENKSVGSGYSPLYALTSTANGTYDITLDVAGLSGNKYLVFSCNMGNNYWYEFKTIRLEP